MSSFQQQQAYQEAAKRFSRAFLRVPERQENRLGSERLFRTLETLTPKQLEIHNYKGEDWVQHIALCCTRRAGKSYLAVPWIVEKGMMAKDPETTMFFIAPTKEQAITLLYRRFMEVKRETGLEFEYKTSPERIEFPTGAVLFFRGAKDIDQLGQLRGYKTSMVWVDEVQDVRDEVLRVIDNAVGPGLRDLAGHFVMSGTPGPIRSGRWFEVSTGKSTNWKTFEWSLFDNPHLAPEAKDLAAIMRDEGLSPDSPKFKREYLAQWVEDEHFQCYHYDIGRNGGVEIWKPGEPLPVEHEWHYCIGVDFGHSPDPSACVTLAWSHTHDTVFVVREWRQPKMTITDLFEQGVRPMWKEYGPCRVVGDAAAKQIIAEINQRWGIGMEPSEKNKKSKAGYIDIVNADMERAKVIVPPEFHLAREMAELTWDPSKFPERKEHPSRDNHLCDAFLYAWLDCFQWIHKELPAKPDSFGTESEKEAYFLKNYIQGKNRTQKDWANDDHFR